MFVIPNRQSDKPYIFNLVDSIRKFHPHEPILIVDSCSPSLDYVKTLQDKAAGYPDLGQKIYFSTNNQHYIDSAVRKAFDTFPNEEFFYILHDSMQVNCNLDYMKFYEFTSYMWFDGRAAWDIPSQKEYVQRQLAEKTNFQFMENFTGLFGITFACKRQVLEKLRERGLNKVLPSNKIEMMASERIWGMALEQVGIDIKKHSVLGNFFTTKGIMNKTEGVIDKFWAKRN